MELYPDYTEKISIDAELKHISTISRLTKSTLYSYHFQDESKIQEIKSNREKYVILQSEDELPWYIEE